MYFEILLFIFAGLYYTMNEVKRRKNSKKIMKELPPGPIGLPILGYLAFLGKSPAITVKKLAEKYGNILSLKLGQYLVVFINDYDTLKEAGKVNQLQGRNQLVLMEPRLYTGLIMLEGNDWHEMRRHTLRCLRDMGFGKRSMEGLIEEEVQEMCNFVRRNLNRPLYLKPVLEVAVVNSMWRLITNEKYDLEDPEKRHVLKVMSDGIADQNILGIVTFLPWLAKLAPHLSGYSKGLQVLSAPNKLVKNVIDKHESTYIDGEERNFIDMTLTRIYNTKDPNSVFYGEFGLRNLHFTIMDLFFTGSDTISSSLGWALAYMACYPRVQDKVQKEIDEVIGKRSACLEDRSRMPYVEATMLEVLRKSSMVPFGVMHAALEDTYFQGYFIPKRTVVLFNLYNVHHDPKYWTDPENFRPERFINDDGSFRKDDHVVAFGVGKRQCPGEQLALDEFFLFLTGILQQFRIMVNPEEDPPCLDTRSGFILPPPKHKLLISERYH